MFPVKRVVISLCMPIKQGCETAMVTISENCRALVARQLLQRRKVTIKFPRAFPAVPDARGFFRSAYKNCLGYV